MFNLPPMTLNLKLLVCCAVMAFSPEAMAASKSNTENLEWMLQKQGKRPVLVYGIPESDGAQFIATCKSPKRITVQAASDVTGLENDEDTSTSFRGDRFSQSFESQVIGIDAENGITGTEFTVTADDPFWPGLIKQGRVRYGVPASKPATMNLGDDRDNIIAFLDACRNPGGGQQAKPVDNNANSCAGFGKLRSKNSNQAVTITFVNKTNAFRALMWLDFKGQPQDFGNLNPGERKTINTFVTHPWMFTDGPGNCQEIYQPRPGDQRFNITKSVISNEAE